MDPQDRVAHLEARVFDRAREAVIGAGGSRCEEVPAWLEDAQGFGGPLGAPGLEGWTRDVCLGERAARLTHLVCRVVVDLG